MNNEEPISLKTLDESYLHLAQTWANDRSKAKRKKVGAILVSKNNQIISDGYNGTPSGDYNICEDLNGNTKNIVLHAETATLTKLLINGCSTSTKDATMYQTLSPCFECAKLMYQAGISRIVYNETYRDISGIKFLTDRSIIVDQIYIDNENCS